MCTQALLAGKKGEYKPGAKIYKASPDKSRDTPSRRKEEVVIYLPEPSTYVKDYFR